ncbi:trigger factor [Oenococcus kitaharae]|uniref:Trigger factor n=1 Tax=Oenococcus kitaharae DSM 17330 TaxID=1045004 RepID=G9WIW4_9LACO|nr:trigger factor [Oenococcus kitaharae]EHN58413.1 Cell division trigger factor [Oenococcus kitaharae DSM 17330]
MVDIIKTNAVFKAGEGNKGTLSFEIPAAQINGGLDEAFNQQKDKINIPGFRKGHVSKDMFLARFGEEALYEDALNAILPDVYDQAVTDADITVVGRPQIIPDDLKHGGPWKIHAEVVLAPAVKLGDYKGIEVEKESDEVSDDELNAELARLQKGEAELVPAKEGDKAENGDTVVIDFDGAVDGNHFDGGKSENFSLSLGSGQFIPGFEDQLVGHQAGDDVDVKVTFPKEYQAKDLAGKEAVFAVKIHELKKLETPALDNEFAKDVDDTVSSLEELKAKTKEKLAKDKADKSQDQFEDAAIQKVVDASSLDPDKLPDELLQDDISRQTQNFFNNLASQGIQPQMYFQITGTSQEQLTQQMTEGAPNRVKTNLVLEAVARAEKVQPTADEINAQVKSLATEYNIKEAEVEKSISAGLLSHDLKIQKAVDIIVSNAKAVAKK